MIKYTQTICGEARLSQMPLAGNGVQAGRVRMNSYGKNFIRGFTLNTEKAEGKVRLPQIKLSSRFDTLIMSR